MHTTIAHPEPLDTLTLVKNILADDLLPTRANAPSDAFTPGDASLQSHAQGSCRIAPISEATPDPFAGCPVRTVLDRIGDKWSVLVILHLGGAQAPVRFNSLRQRIGGISQRMLTVTLRTLEQDGLLTRHVFAEVPPRVEYELTLLGMSLLEMMMPLASWAKTHQQEILAARGRFQG